MNVRFVAGLVVLNMFPLLGCGDSIGPAKVPTNCPSAAVSAAVPCDCPKPPPPPEASSIKAGDTVVVRRWSTSFHEAKVESADEVRLKVRFDKDSDPEEVDRIDAFLLPKPGASLSVAPGDLVIARIGSSWDVAKVVRQDAGVITLRYAFRKSPDTEGLPPERVLKPTPSMAATFQKALEESEVRAAWDKKVEEAGRPHRPANYRPRVGEEVLALRWSSIYSGKVRSLSGSKATIDWFDKGAKPAELDIADVSPSPTTKQPRPRVGDIVLIKPSSNGSSWSAREVAALEADRALLKEQRGEAKAVSHDQYAVLRPIGTTTP